MKNPCKEKFALTEINKTRKALLVKDLSMDIHEQVRRLADCGGASE